MPVTTPVQVRLDAGTVQALDARAAKANTSRAEVMRELVTAALATPAAPASDPLIDRIADEVGGFAATMEAMLDATQAMRQEVRAAHAAARLGALMLLPSDRQAEFVDKLAGVSRS